MTKIEFILANLQLKHAQAWYCSDNGDLWIANNLFEIVGRDDIPVDEATMDRIEARFDELLDAEQDRVRGANPKLVAASRAADHAQELCDLLAKMTFVVETVAHLQGKERELLPLTDRARILLDKIEGLPTLERELDLCGDVRQGYARMTRQGDFYVMEDSRNVTIPKHRLKISETPAERLEIHWQGFHEHTNGK